MNGSIYVYILVCVEGQDYFQKISPIQHDTQYIGIDKCVRKHWDTNLIETNKNMSQAPTVFIPLLLFHSVGEV